MDINDMDSPLRSMLNCPVKRITPAVPVPDWHISSPGRPIPSPVIVRATPSPLAARDGPSTPRQSTIPFGSPSTSRNLNSIRTSVISSNVHCSRGDSELKCDLTRTTELNASIDVSKSSDHIDRPPLTPSRISGDVSFTPTHSAFTPHSIGSSQNPHATIVAHTPIASGPEQARSSIKLQNCVSTVSLGCELKLLDIYCRTRFSEYNPSRFHGVVMRILEPRATALVFRSGKLVCTGAKNEHDSLLAARKFARIIQKLGYPVNFSEFKIQNFVATADLRFPIRLEALQQAHGQFTSYEPELFPGLIYRLVRPRIVLLIFVNGKIVFTGGKSRNDITESLNIIYPILRSFKKN